MACVGPNGSAHDLFRVEVLVPAWTVAVRVAMLLGGVARAHVALIGFREVTPGYDWPSAEDPIRRWIDLPVPEEAVRYTPLAADVEYVADEVRRQAGDQVWADD